MCFIHSLTAKSNTHGPGENQMNTGFTIEGFPSIGAWVSYALGSENDNLPAFVAIPDPRGVPQTGPANWSSGFLAGRVSRNQLYDATGRSPIWPCRPDRWRPTIAAARDLLAISTTTPGTARRRQRAGGADCQLRTGGPIAIERARRWAIFRRRARPRPKCMASTTRIHFWPASPAIACSPGGCWNAACGSCNLFNGAYAMGEGVGNWDGHKQLKCDYDRHGPILDRAGRGIAARLESARHVARHAGGVVDGVWPDADLPARRRKGAITIPTDLPPGWPAPA